MARKAARSSASRAKEAGEANSLDDLIASVVDGAPSGEALYRRIYSWFRTAILAGGPAGRKPFAARGVCSRNNWGFRAIP